MCDFDTLFYSLKNELLNFFKEAETPLPKVKMAQLKSGKLCGLANLAKLILYLERDGYVSVINKDQDYKDWEIQVEAGILDFYFGH